MNDTASRHRSDDSERVPPHHPAVLIFNRVMRGFQGSAWLRLWNGALHAPGNAPPAFTLVVRDPAVLRRLVLQRNHCWAWNAPASRSTMSKGCGPTTP